MANGGIIGPTNVTSFGKNTQTVKTSSGDITTQPGTRLIDFVVVAGGAGGGGGYRAGGDWVTDGEELIRVGEGGRERVTITPLEDVNLEGGTQGITLNISGNVLTDTFVEENVVPSLREALRQGETIA